MLKIRLMTYRAHVLMLCARFGLWLTLFFLLSLLLWPRPGRAQSNIALNRPIFAAGFVADHPPVLANDGDSTSAWIHNQHTGWIEIDLGSPSTITAIRLLVVALFLAQALTRLMMRSTGRYS